MARCPDVSQMVQQMQGVSEWLAKRAAEQAQMDAQDKRQAVLPNATTHDDAMPQGDGDGGSTAAPSQPRVQVVTRLDPDALEKAVQPVGPVSALGSFNPVEPEERIEEVVRARLAACVAASG